MHPPASVPDLGVRRNNRRGLYYRQKRGCNLAELAVLSEGPPDAHPRPPIVIALIDPKPLTRESILKMLDDSFSEQHVKLIGAPAFDALLGPVEADRSSSIQAEIHLVVLYIRSAGVTDDWVLEQLQSIETLRPEIPVVMISDRDDPDDVIRALNYGVRGYIPTSISAEVAIAALTLVQAGGTYIPADFLRSEGFEIPLISEAAQQKHAPDELNLTLRELAVIDLLREGYANKVIAKKLNMRESTVKVHVRNILKKLRVSNRTHAATVANRLLASAQLLGGSERPH